MKKKTTTKQKSTGKSRKPHNLSPRQKAKLRKVEAEAATNLSATINAMEELTESCFIRQAVNNAIAEQCERYKLSPVKYGDQGFNSTLETILKFGPVIDEMTNKAKKTSIERIEHGELDRIAVYLSRKLHDDTEAVRILCGYLEYLAELSNSDQANYLDDDVCAVTQRLFLSSNAGNSAADEFVKQSRDLLLPNLKALTAVY